MKKIVLFLLLLFFPLFVFAKDTCDSSNIKVESITLDNTKGNIKEIKEASSSNQKISLGLQMNVVGDTASYRIVLKNTSSDDYYFDENSLNLDTDYVNYEVIYSDDNIIKAGEEKVVILRVSYKTKVNSTFLENGKYTDTHVMKLGLQDNKNIADEIFTNPKTSQKRGLFIFFIIICCVFFLFKNKHKEYILLFLFGIGMLPFTVKALCRCQLELETNIVIDAKEAVFLPGRKVNAKIPSLAGDRKNVTSIIKSDVEPISLNKENDNIVSVDNSSYPIYMWYDNGTIYWWSEDDTPGLNENARGMFSFLLNLCDISGLESFDTFNTKDLGYFLTSSSVEQLTVFSNWNTSNVEFLDFAFYTNKLLINLSGLEKWDTSQVISMYSLFGGCEDLNNIDAIKNWNVSNVKNMHGMFQMLFSIEEIDLSHWETKSLEDMNHMFAMSFLSDGTSPNSLKRIILSDKFDTRKVTDMSFAFYNLNYIEDYSFLELLDTSSVVDMTDMFYGNFNLLSFDYLKYWDVSHVTNMTATFTNNPNLKSLSGLENWDVSNVTNMSYMFSHSPLIEDALALNDWDISNVTNFDLMFFQAKTHPEFTKRAGTWNNRGTFTPSS